MALAEIRRCEYLLDNQFFMNIDSEGNGVQKGKVCVSLTVEHKPSGFLLQFHLGGTVIVSCDRCLDEMEVPVESNSRLTVKLGKEYAEESDEILIISEEEGALNLAWFLYEFVVLAVPMKHVHPPGKCNKTMSAKLKKHSVRSHDDDAPSGYDEEESASMPDDGAEAETVDPRWDKLKDLKEDI
jgi:uncharacterized metal-binding protein YceD (DUF177 family)